MNFSVTLVGAGNMGGAMLKGWISNGMKADNITVLDPAPSDTMRDYLSSNNIRHVENADELQPPDVMLLAVKPQMMESVLPGLVGLVGPQTVAVSVAAGTTLATLGTFLGDVAMVRVMPNTPSLVLKGMSVGCPNSKVTEMQRQNVHALMHAIGAVEWVEDEKLIDAVTAVSGSGPAYVFYLAECMAEAGKAAGLPDTLAMTLAAQTVSGAGELLGQSQEPPAQLRRNVTSPNGTTAAALDVLMTENGMGDLVERAVMAAKKRSEELS